MATQTSLPRSVRRGPRITIACECGQRNYLHYGEQWTCEQCGRRWNTLRIPLEQYAEIRRTQLRYRRVPLAIALLSLACVIAFIVIGKAVAGLVLVAFAATAWSMFARPLYRKRYRQAIADRPDWKIEPE